MRKEIVLDKIPGIRESSETDPDVPQDVSSTDVNDIVDNLTEDQISDAWNAEAQSWAELGISPGQNIVIDQFLFKSRLEVLIEVLTKAEIINQTEFNSLVRRYMLKQMISLRREFKSEMLKAQLTQGIQSPVPKGLFVPPGFKKDG